MRLVSFSRLLRHIPDEYLPFIQIKEINHSFKIEFRFFLNSVLFKKKNSESGNSQKLFAMVELKFKLNKFEKKKIYP